MFWTKEKMVTYVINNHDFLTVISQNYNKHEYINVINLVTARLLAKVIA